MTNEEKARDICSLFNEIYGVNIERESHISVGIVQDILLP